MLEGREWAWPEEGARPWGGILGVEGAIPLGREVSHLKSALE